MIAVPWMRLKIVASAVVLMLVGAVQGSVRPQDDLFAYANGAWLMSVEIAGDRVTFGTFAELADKTETDLKAISIVVPAAILPPPVFDAAADDAVNSLLLLNASSG